MGVVIPVGPERGAVAPGPDPMAPSTITLPAAPVSARLAREFVTSVTGKPEDPRVALVVTELVVNAVIHAHAEPRLTVRRDPGTLTLEVWDDGPGRPEVRPFDAATTSGRGLALVDQVSDEWGVEPSGDGKSVWARFSA